jgi:hypothetical protein
MDTGYIAHVMWSAIVDDGLGAILLFVFVAAVRLVVNRMSR